MPLQLACQNIGYCVPKCREAWSLRKCGNCLEAVRKCSCCKDLCCGGHKITAEPKSAEASKEESAKCANRDRNEEVLWYRYYKLYIMGYTEEKSHASAPDSADRKSSGPPTDDEFYGCCSSLESCFHILSSVHVVNCVRSFILLVKYFAQLATVPLLMLQMFDTYALLCFAPNHSYCGDRSEYDIHLLQAAITMFFYIAIAVAQLTSTALEWDPIESFD